MTRGFDKFVFAVAAIFAIAVVAVAFANSHFILDDFAGFYLASTQSFWQVLLTPIDLHFVPLHRFVNQLVYWIAPLEYGLALGVLLLAHALAVVTLYDTLQRLKDSPVNAVLICLYATNVYLGVLFLWWTSGLHRLPYVALAVGTLYQYLKYRSGGARRHLVYAALCFAAALGFYSKAPLIPITLLGVEVCLLPGRPRREVARNLLVIAGFLAFGAASVLGARALVDARFAQLQADPGFLLLFVRQSFEVLRAAVFGVVVRGDVPLASGIIGAGWLALVAYTVVRRPWNAVVWVTGITVVALHIAVIGVSHRVAKFGLSTVWSYRYYFELMHLVVIFAAVALHGVPSLPSAPRDSTWQKAAVGFGSVLLLALASISFLQFRSLLDTPRFSRHRDAKVFMENLDAGLDALRRLPRDEYTFVYGLAPERITGKTAAHFRRYSDFLTIFGVDGRFDARAPRLYQITDTGEVQRVMARERP